MANSKEKLTDRFTTIIGYLLPLLSSIPPLPVWIGLMAIPFASYLIFMFTTNPSLFPQAVLGLFLGGYLYASIVIVGFVLLVFSIIHLRRKKQFGLVITGPYRFVRHPQYLGMLLITMAFTVRSYILASVTFGVSWISPEGMIVIWIGIMWIYMILALIEETYLKREFGDEFLKYRRKSGFFYPVPTGGRVWLDIVLAVAISVLALFAWVGYALSTFPTFY